MLELPTRAASTNEGDTSVPGSGLLKFPRESASEICELVDILQFWELGAEIGCAYASPVVFKIVEDSRDYIHYLCIIQPDITSMLYSRVPPAPGRLGSGQNSESQEYGV